MRDIVPWGISIAEATSKRQSGISQCLTDRSTWFTAIHNNFVLVVYC